jgi:Mitoribosomal protein mL52
MIRQSKFLIVKTVLCVYIVAFDFLGGRVLNFHTTPAAYIDQKWRKANRLGPNPTSEGVLVHAPDYSFVDGRETPIAVSAMQVTIQIPDDQFSISSSPTNWRG